MTNQVRSMSITYLFSLMFFASLHAAELKPAQAGIASANHYATNAGLDILKKGGNAFDAAVTVAAVLAVVEPESSGIGGGGFWLIHQSKNNKDTFIDGREYAPEKASANMYLDEQGNVNRDLAVNGPLAAGIPGMPAALAHLAKKYGRLPLSLTLKPAIDLARNGFPVTEKYLDHIVRRVPVLNRYPAAAKQFLDHGKAPKQAWILKQPDLAKTLERLSHGHAGFYTGKTAKLLVKESQKDGGIWTLDDLAQYHVIEREPIRTTYHDFEIISSPPPSSGGIVLAEIFNILELHPMNEYSETDSYHLTIEAMRRAYRDRAAYMGDPDFVTMPIKRLISKDYAAGLDASIRMDKATPSSALPGIKPHVDGTNTTHYSIIDKDGNKVSSTMSVNLSFGSAYVAAGTGFLFNNEMDDFSAKPGEPNAYGLVGNEANSIQPRKRMLSSMTPSFINSEDREGIIGTPGGSRIITMVLLGMMEMIEGKPVEDWTSRPRFHHQYLPDMVFIEPNAFSPEIIADLESRGHKIKQGKHTWGNMNAVLWDKKSNEVTAAPDPRWPAGLGATSK
ncbi:MAG: gamma-glutamyltransferase [bacterium]